MDMNTQDTTPMEHKGLKEQAKLLEPIIRIGKNGLTDNVVEEIKNHLKKRKMVKVKMLKSFLEDKDKKLLAKEIAEKTNSTIVDSAGFAVVLRKIYK